MKLLGPKSNEVAFGRARSRQSDAPVARTLRPDASHEDWAPYAGLAGMMAVITLLVVTLSRTPGRKIDVAIVSAAAAARVAEAYALDYTPINVDPPVPSAASDRDATVVPASSVKVGNVPRPRYVRRPVAPSNPASDLRAAPSIDPAKTSADPLRTRIRIVDEDPNPYE